MKGLILPDSDAVKVFVETLHTLASECDGQLTLCVFGEDPKTGKALEPIIKRYDIGKVDEMYQDAMNLTQKPHHNVYAPLSVISHNVKGNSRGKAEDITAVLGLCADFDDNQALMYQDRLPLSADMVLETSQGRFQCFYLFDKPCNIKDARNAAELLQNYCGCDFSTKDIAHVWRVPGTLNYPNKKKYSQGRALEPQLVFCEEDWGQTRTEVNKLIDVSQEKTSEKEKGYDSSAEDFKLAKHMLSQGKAEGDISIAIQKQRQHDDKSKRLDYIVRTIEAANPHYS